MANNFNQYDPKTFKETLGSFGTTTNPMGGNQLQQLQTAIRQGVKHVELHLSSAGKGQFGTSDVPDKYGFEQRRTIMQLAKLNEQTLSVHGTFNINTFSGLGQGGFNEMQRANNIKEIDETVKFAAETAKSGAIVFHLHETALPPTAPGELNLPEWYLEKLQKENPQEYDKIMKNYLTNDELSRQFVDNPDLESELRVKFDHLSNQEKTDLKNNFGVNNWKEYYEYNKIEQMKLEQEGTPLVVVGNSLTKASRAQDVIDLNGLKNLTEKEKKFLTAHGINTNYEHRNIDDFQRIQATFTNGLPSELADLSPEEYQTLKHKFVIQYKDVLYDSNRMKSKADKEFFQKSMDMQIELAKLQKADLQMNKKRYSQYIDEIEEIKQKERQLMRELDTATREGNKQKEKEILSELNGGFANQTDADRFNELYNKYQTGTILQEEMSEIQELSKKQQGGLKTRKHQLEVQEVGQIEYQKLDRYDEMMGQLNEQIKKTREQKQNAKVITDEIFEKNASSMGHLGLKALQYQLDLKKNSQTAKQDLENYNKQIDKTKKQLETENDIEKRSKLNQQLQKLKYDRRLIYGRTDYADINIEDNPLYLAPENMMAGYGYLSSLEEYKGVIRTAWDEFAQKLMSNESTYKQIREQYEQETGKKISTLEDAKQIAKKHIGGTFDNAHAGVWLKYFKREDGESEEHRIERFNKWLNTEAESMAKEGIIKHIHFNDTQGKDDDHNLIGSGVLDVFDLKEKLRNAGVKEPLIVEAGNRGTSSMMHVLNAFDVFNPELGAQIIENQIANSHRPGYGISAGSSPSDWITTQRTYENRPQFSRYGMNPETFQTQSHPQQGLPRGGWSQTGFL